VRNIGTNFAALSFSSAGGAQRQGVLEKNFALKGLR